MKHGIYINQIPKNLCQDGFLHNFYIVLPSLGKLCFAKPEAIENQTLLSSQGTTSALIPVLVIFQSKITPADWSLIKER